MNRTDKIAADVAWARPATIPADLILNYSGPAFAGVKQIEAWGKPFVLGYESITTRAYAGGDAGQQDAEQWLSVARTIPGYVEGRCGFWFCAADENSTPAWALPNITEYARRFTTTVVAACGSVPGLSYGNRAAATAGANGIAAGGGIPLPWGVGTWGYDEGGGANLPPGDSDAALVQSGNTPGPAEGTDLNWVYVDLAAFHAYGGPTAQPTAPIEEDEMYYRIVTASDATTPWFLTWIHPQLGRRVKRVLDEKEAAWWKLEAAFIVPGVYAPGNAPYLWPKSDIDALPDAPPLGGGGGNAPTHYTGVLDLRAA